MKAIILTIFPELFPGPLAASVTGRAIKEKKIEIETINIRDFGAGKHKNVDDTPAGGGAGMVMRADVLGDAIDAALKKLPNAQLIYTSPKGEHFKQHHAVEFTQQGLIILCGRFEGIDERIIEHYKPLEISLGDFVLTGGEYAAHAILDACIRLLPGVIGEAESLQEESFGLNQDYALLLEYPQYTAPPIYKGMEVPAVLKSGNHAEIKNWRKSKSLELTKAKRPELIAKNGEIK